MSSSYWNDTSSNRIAPLPAPGVYDSRYHANILLGPNIVARGTWKEPLLNYAVNGQLVTDRNRDELAYVMNGVELIDPDTIRSPANVWS